MNDYISRKALLDWAHKFYPEDKVFASAIINAPAADVAPVMHGRWIDEGEYAVCTECGVRSGTQYDGVEPIPLMTQFCPNCGAKMDGGNVV